VLLIVLIAVASIAGSLIEQENLYQDWRPPYLYYPARYGPFWGNLLMRLGLTHAYSSLWYASLVLLVVTSLIICSLHRLVPLHRMLVRPQVWKLPHFLSRQPITAELAGDLDGLAVQLKKRGFKIWRDRECLYAERGRLSRYGPYIIHIGLLFVAFAAFAKGIPGWDLSRDVWIPDGQTVKVPDTNFAITSHKFTMELYPNGMPSRFVTDAGIVQDGKEVFRQTLEVNHPLPYGGWDIYQASFRQEPGVAHLRVMGADGAPVTRLDVDLRQPETEYALSDQVKMVVTAYYHDFVLDPATKEPTNASFEVKNPVFMVEFVDRATATVLGRSALLVLGNAKPFYQGPLYLEVEKVDPRWYTALKLHKDLTTPYMFFGLGIVFLGMLITFFLFHWQLWVREESGRLLLGAHAHKNKFGLKQEVKRLPGTPIGEGNVS
jgi:cytochrome c biogenesis protein